MVPFRNLDNRMSIVLILLVINGEKAAFHSPVFAQKRIRTFEMLLNNILEKYASENNVSSDTHVAVKLFIWNCRKSG